VPPRYLIDHDLVPRLHDSYGRIARILTECGDCRPTQAAQALRRASAEASTVRDGRPYNVDGGEAELDRGRAVTAQIAFQNGRSGQNSRVAGIERENGVRPLCRPSAVNLLV
jgi:hypothetical protein